MQQKTTESFAPNNQVYANMFNNEHSHWWFRGLRGVLLYWLNRLGVESVLDAGCGTGENSYILSSQGYQVHSCDVSEEAVSYCRQRGLTNITKASVSKMTYQSSSFDCVACMDVLACLAPDDYKDALKEFKRCLKPHGYLIINTAALPSLVSTHDTAWRVQRRFVLRDLERDLTELGFEILKGTHRVFFLFPLAVIFKLVTNIHYRNSKDVPDHIGKVNTLLNGIFTGVMLGENYILRLINLPIGTSIFIVARKM